MRGAGNAARQRKISASFRANLVTGPSSFGIDQGRAMKRARLTPAVVAGFYEAAFEPRGIVHIPELIGRLTGADSVGLWITEGGRIVDMAVSDTLRDTHGPYVAHFHRLDPWLAGTLRNLDKVVLGSEAFSERELVKTEFYNDFARQAGLFRPMGGAIRLTPGVQAGFGIQQPFASEPFEESDKRPMEAALPHLRRALQLWLRRRKDAAGPEWQESALDTLSFGVVVCDGSGRLVQANAAAEALARSSAGIVFGGGGSVRAQVVHEARRLAALIHSAAYGGGGGAIRLAGRADAASLLVLVTPLPAKLHRNGEPGHVLLAMRPHDEGLAHGADRLSALFGLSPNQAALALALYEGKTFEEIAEERGVKVTTLRTHFAQVLSRTGTKSQRDLMRLLGNLPPLR
jgi:DNA-binding CsgD family transcriptional regulator/PAS domain-containing protein